MERTQTEPARPSEAEQREQHNPDEPGPGTPTPAHQGPGRQPAARPARTHLGRTARRSINAAHVAASVGLVGVEWVMIALGVIAASTGDPVLRHDVYRLMWVLIHVTAVPLSVLALVTGLVLALRTPWGLFRHRWVWVKLLLTLVVIAVGVGLMRQWISQLADESRGGAPPATVQGLQLAGAGVQLAALLAATALSVFKPSGPRRRTLAGR